MNIIIGADIVPTEKNERLFEQNKLDIILGNDLHEIWNNATYKIFNMEAPISDSNTPIDKCGPVLKIKPSCITGLKSLNPTFLVLANNHIMDLDTEGYHDTINILNREKIDYIGIGDSKKTVKKDYTLDFKDKHIGFYNCCETEFCIADENKPGANQFNFLYSLDDIKKLKSENDYVVVLYHGGKEYYRYPSPELKQKCEKMIDVGADLVICQHSHCIGCEENYKKGKIVYGQGNFVFNGRDIEERKTSLLINIKEDFNIEYIPIMETQYGTRLANKEEANLILNQFYERSEAIKDDEFVIEEYKKFAKAKTVQYLKSFKGHRSFLFKVIDKITCGRLLKYSYSKNYLLDILNYIQCEAHRELVIMGLKEELENIK